MMAMIANLPLTLWTLLFLLVLSTCRSPAAATDEVSPRDAHAIAQLRDAGSDLSRPHRIDFFLYFADEANARAFATAFRARDFDARVSHAADRDAWQVKLARTMLPEEAALGALRAEFVRASESAGGSYDGWGAAVVR